MLTISFDAFLKGSHCCLLSFPIFRYTLAINTGINHSYIKQTGNPGNISDFFALIPTNPCIMVLIGNESKMLVFFYRRRQGISISHQAALFTQ